VKSFRQVVLRLTAFAVAVALISLMIVQAIERPVPGPTVTYNGLFTNAFGLRPNADVRIRGVQVGKVDAVELHDGKIARVRFTLQNEYTLSSVDTIAIKFQNLTGQRYLAIVQGSTPGEPMDSAKDISTDHTIPAFDITTLFNGLRPLMKSFDPSVFNRLATNVLALVEGSDGSGVGAILDDLAKLASYASDRSAVLKVLMTNFGRVAEVLGNRARYLSPVIAFTNVLFGQLSDKVETFRYVYVQGERVFSRINDLLNQISTLMLGGDDDNELDRRLHEVIPDTTVLVESLKSIPALIDGLERAIPSKNVDLDCSKGNAQMPDGAAVLLQGQPVTLCNP
jgi:phospholipid/cholesterol/gamma-HCH transport system substrate-binding protein